MPSVFLKTYGCQMNERDSEAVAAQLVAKGYALAPSEDVADVVLLNTCSVRDNAEQTALGKMQSVIGVGKKLRPGQIFGFMGCMAQSRGKELIDRLPDVDLVLGTQKFHRAAEYLDELLAGVGGFSDLLVGPALTIQATVLIEVEAIHTIVVAGRAHDGVDVIRRA